MGTLKSIWQRICLATLVAMLFALFNPMLLNSASAAVRPPDHFSGVRFEVKPSDTATHRIVVTVWDDGDRTETEKHSKLPYSVTINSGEKVSATKEGIPLGWGTTPDGNCYMPGTVDPLLTGFDLTTGKQLWQVHETASKYFTPVPWNGSGNVRVVATNPENGDWMGEIEAHGVKCGKDNPPPDTIECKNWSLNQHAITAGQTVVGTGEISGNADLAWAHIDWGDGNVEPADINNLTLTHTYPVSGTFESRLILQRKSDGAMISSDTCADKVKVNGPENPPPTPKAPICGTFRVKPGVMGQVPFATTFTWTYSDPDHQVLGIRYDFGDGSGGGAALPLTFDKLEHTYWQTGPYTATLWLATATDPDITSDGCTVHIQVTDTTVPPPPPNKCEKTERVYTSDWSPWKTDSENPNREVSYRTYQDVSVLDHTTVCGEGQEPRYRPKQNDQPPPPPVKKPNSPSVTPDFGWDCSKLGNGNYRVWAYGRVVSAKYLDQVIGIMGQQNSKFFFGPSPTPGSDHTERLELDGSLAINWVKAPALETGPTFFGNTIHKGWIGWWPRVRDNEKAWYDKSKVVAEAYGWQYQIFGENGGEPIMWSYEPIAYPSQDQLAAKGCISTPEVPEVNKPAPVINRCPDRLEAAPEHGAVGQKAVDAQAPNAEISFPQHPELLDHGRAWTKWLGEGCEIPTFDVGQMRRDDIVELACHVMGICKDLDKLRVGDQIVYHNLETGETKTYVVTDSRPVKRGGEEYVYPERLGVDLAAFTCFHPKWNEKTHKWEVVTSWFVGAKLVSTGTSA